MRATLLAILLALPSCGKALPVGFDQEAPDGRIHAIIEAARRRDTSRIPDLVEQLDSDDPAVRLFAIRALEYLTGTTLGYDYAAPLTRREEAIARWEQYARDLAAAEPSP